MLAQGLAASAILMDRCCLGMLQLLPRASIAGWDLTAVREAGRQVACPALSKCCLCVELATTGLPSLSKALQGTAWVCCVTCYPLPPGEEVSLHIHPLWDRQSLQVLQ